MGFFSAFDTFGMMRFSSEPSQAEKIYVQLSNTYGANFQGPVAEAKTYADAMALGIAQCELDRAAGQFRADRATEMLPGLEAEYEIVPAPDANMRTRRAGLAAAQALRNGARYDAMVDGLSDILGSAFVTYYVNDVTTTPHDPVPADPTTVGAYKLPGGTIQVVTLASVTMPSASPQTVYYSHFCGDDVTLKSGETLVVDPGLNGPSESISLITADNEKFTAVFSKPHSAGCFATTAPFANWTNWQRCVLVVVTAATLSNLALVQKINNYMRKWSRGVTLWFIVADGGTRHTAGPFYPKHGLPNVTPVGVVSY